ncbi:addiction module antidote protein, HigA family [Salmonella enterica]|uniref:Addiction module antidote protein, HigA family n=1 Tax=Salmonella enterica I TaxID=59201 RepID=A0A3R1B4K3_SALET|nr:addiction module antidote protein, HigA family [Salmonella enterica]EBQ9005111.1 addiction module antidote protein, HigA family [Salmonella enterica subsp. enterica serovar Blockley]EBQ9480358.1 addiction module antidote protein, HigA family [Salmonella enterica subsp. enterica serovar Kokomlemle]EBZ5140087.1 addiction module antidote protein, HigA family [Salmonella enterica subsp. enterica serovar Antsalova]ECD6162217.1 addiction module antidote protein, HigA family [Salmonella enterica su
MRMANPPHPREIIADVLDDLNIGIREFARALDVAPSTVQRLISGQAAVSPEMAVKLAAVIGSTSDMWLRLQSTYSLEKAEREVDVSHLTQLYRPEPLSTRTC